MFNAPRQSGGRLLSSSAFISSSSSPSSFDPLASSTPNVSFGGDVDPWSAVPSPARVATPPRPRRDTEESGPIPPVGVIAQPTRDGLNGLIEDPPALYLSLLDQMETGPSGEVSLSSIHRLLATSQLPASTIEKIINLTSRDKSCLSRQEFFCALALVAHAQSAPDDTDISVESLSAALPDLPLPRLTAPTESRTNGYTVPTSSISTSPWDTAPRQNGGTHTFAAPDSPLNGTGSIGESSREAEAERGYWKRLENVEVSLIAEKEGWFLQKYRVESDKRTDGAVSRRYSDFVWLLDTLVKRYPFRLLPALPPKKIGPDASFLEQRRKALKRFINLVVNHPVMKDDGALNVFLTEPNFEAWRKRVKVSTEEESASKKLNPAQEMAIPADLDEKLGTLRDHLPGLLGSYQKLVTVAERQLARLQAAAADASRLALSLDSAGEEMPKACFRCAGGGSACSLCRGVGRGLHEIGETWARVAEHGEKRALALTLGSIETLKTQRDLYLAFRDLFLRHDRLSKDTVDSLRKKVESRGKKIETIRAGQKPGWEQEADKLISQTDQDNSTITTLLSRRVFIRACMWHELGVVFHTRQAAQATLGWRAFGAAASTAAGAEAAIWDELSQRLESMPIE